jgi:hypothetical protein
MRALLAAGLVLLLALGAAAPHDHAGASDSEGCAACLLRSADVPDAPAPELAAGIAPEGPAAPAPGLPPLSGAPLGAIPGQSPPVAA